MAAKKTSQVNRRKKTVQDIEIEIARLEGLPRKRLQHWVALSVLRWILFENDSTVT